MIVPFLSEQALKSNPATAAYWLDPAVNIDSAMDLDREIMKSDPKLAIYVRPLMRLEFESDFKGGQQIAGGMTRAQIMQEMTDLSYDTKFNARIVLIADREFGVRLKDYVFLFWFPDTTMVEVDDRVIAQFHPQLKLLKQTIKEYRKNKRSENKT